MSSTEGSLKTSSVCPTTEVKKVSPYCRFVPRGPAPTVDWSEVLQNLADFSGNAKALFALCDECTESSCDSMRVSSAVAYSWTDGVSYTRPTQVAARRYVELLMLWIEEQSSALWDGCGTPPATFKHWSKFALKRLFRVYAHLHYSHKQWMEECALTDEFKAQLRAYLRFVTRFEVVRPKEFNSMRPFLLRMSMEQTETTPTTMKIEHL